MNKTERDTYDVAWGDGFAFGHAMGAAAERYAQADRWWRTLILGILIGGVSATAGSVAMTILWGAKP